MNICKAIVFLLGMMIWLGQVNAADKGEQIYKQACFVCHTTGVAGAPKLGNVADWKSRIAQGKKLLIEHAIKGFQGKKGIMPAKGGRTDISDEDIAAAVSYMIKKSK